MYRLVYNWYIRTMLWWKSNHYGKCMWLGIEVMTNFFINSMIKGFKTKQWLSRGFFRVIQIQWCWCNHGDNHACDIKAFVVAINIRCWILYHSSMMFTWIALFFQHVVGTWRVKHPIILDKVTGMVLSRSFPWCDPPDL